MRMKALREQSSLNWQRASAGDRRFFRRRRRSESIAAPRTPRSERAFLRQPFLALDCETTGLDPATDRLIEVAWTIRRANGTREDHARLIALERPLSSRITELTGLSPAAFGSAPAFDDVAPALVTAMESVYFIVAYNAPFDRAFLAAALNRAGLALPSTPWIDPLVLVRELDATPDARMNLRAACTRHGIQTQVVHRALTDATAAASLLACLSTQLEVALGHPPTLEFVLAVQAQFRREQAKRREERTLLATQRV